jgi:hypothetical protein
MSRQFDSPQIDSVTSYKRVIPRGWLQTASVVLVLATIVGSFLPSSDKLLLGTEPFDPRQHLATHVGMLHRSYHLAAFALIAGAPLLLARNLKDEFKALLFVIGLGCAIETAQHLIGFSLVFEWWDLRDDVYAATGAFTLVQIANAVDRSRIACPSNGS